MPYPEENLHSNEELVLDLHPHWWTITPSIAALAVVLGIGLWAVIDRWEGLVNYLLAVLVLANLIWFGLRYLQLITTHFVLTTDRVIYRSGILAKRGVEIPLDSINAIHFSQKIWERVLGLGDLKVDSASVEGVSEFENIRKPNLVQNEIYIQMENNENRKFDRVAQGLNAASTGGAASPSIPEQIAQLAQLRDQGHLTPEEFEAKKADLLRRM
ncbi:MAG: PH domain-containing protein [Acidimicrobiales bacterium]